MPRLLILNQKQAEKLLVALAHSTFSDNARFQIDTDDGRIYIERNSEQKISIRFDPHLSDDMTVERYDSRSQFLTAYGF